MKSSQENTASQLNTILLLFVIIRLVIIFMFTPEGWFNLYTDAFSYYHAAQQSEQGYLPDINMWYEYPPLSAYWVQGIYAFTRQILPLGDFESFTFDFFARLLRLSLLIPECGILILLHRIAHKVYGMVQANWMAWVYSSLSAPLFYMIFSHQNIAVFFTLLSLYLYLNHRRLGSAAALALGILAKLTPAFLLGPLVRDMWPAWKKGVVFIGATAAGVAIGYAPFIIMGGGRWVWASFTALARGHSYDTPWAILDGNWGPGGYGPPETRLDLAQAELARGNLSVLPAWLPLLLFGLLYAYLFFRPYRPTPENLLRFSALTLTIFHLWSKGWSPQWIVSVIPLVLLSLPGREGLRFVIALTVATLLEWPLGDAFQSHFLLGLAIMARTIIWGVLAWRLLADKSRIAPPALSG